MGLVTKGRLVDIPRGSPGVYCMPLASALGPLGVRVMPL